MNDQLIGGGKTPDLAPDAIGQAAQNIAGQAHDVLAALFLNGPLYDHQLSSKTGLAECRDLGLVVVVKGLNVLTNAGVEFGLDIDLDAARTQRDEARAARVDELTATAHQGSQMIAVMQALLASVARAAPEGVLPLPEGWNTEAGVAVIKAIDGGVTALVYQEPAEPIVLG